MNFFRNLFWLSSVVTFFYLHRGLSYTEILTLTAVMSTCVIALEIPTGMFADRYGKKRSLILSNLLLLFSISLYLIADSFALFAVSFALLGAGIAFSSGITEALLYDSLIEKSSMSAMMGKFNSAEVLAGMLSPPVASILAKDFAAWQFDLLIYLTMISYFLSFLITFTLKESSRKEVQRFSITNSLEYIKNNKRLIVFILNSSLVSSALITYMFLWQPQLRLSGVSVEALGTLLAMGSFGIFLVNRYINRITGVLGFRTSLFLSSIVPALGFLIAGFMYNTLISVAAYIIIRIVASMRSPLFSELINKELRSPDRATTLSTVSLLAALFSLLIRPGIGFLSDIGLHWGFLGLSVLCFLATILFPIRKRHTGE